MKRRKWSLEEQADLLRMTGELLSRGYSLSDALESVIYYFPKSRTIEIQTIHTFLQEGYPLYLILQKFEFDNHLTGYIYFAEQHGGLETAFCEGSNMLQKRARDISKLMKLISYPLFLFLITIILFIFVKNYLLPRFSTLFATMDLEANFFTNIIYFADHYSTILFIMILIFLFLITIYYFYAFKRMEPLNQKKIMMKIPVVAKMLRLFYTHYFCAQLSHLLSGGISINEALTMFEKNKDQPFYEQVAAEMKEELKEGKSLVEIFQKYSFFERDLARIVKHGQENGKLHQELMFLSSRCLLQLEERTEQLMKRVQPVIFLFIGLMIISMYLAVLLPMFHLLKGI